MTASFVIAMLILGVYLLLANEIRAWSSKPVELQRELWLVGSIPMY